MPWRMGSRRDRTNRSYLLLALLLLILIRLSPARIKIRSTSESGDK